MLISRTSKLDSEGRLRDSTLHNYVETLATAAKRRQNPIENEVRRAAHDWIDGPLTLQNRVNTQARLKEMTASRDITTLMKTLFTVEHMASYTSTRAVLYTSLFLNLAVDCSGRVGELLASDHKKTVGTKCLRWEHVELFAFLNVNGYPTLKAKIRFRDLKGNSKNADQRSKTIPLRLLPLKLAAEDGLRQLVTLAIIDGVLEDVSCWEDLEYLTPGEYGTRLKVKADKLKQPVRFHETIQSPSSSKEVDVAVGDSLIACEQVFLAASNHTINGEPLQTRSMSDWLNNLGKKLGYESKLVTYCLRRGAAYLLAMNCSEEERCGRMGHKTGDTVYWSHYRNEVSTVDFQAIAHRTEVEDISMLSSIALNSHADAPKRLSIEGFQKVQKSPDLSALIEIESRLLDTLLQQGSIAEATKCGGKAFEDYDRARKNVRNLKASLRAAEYRKEYRNFFDLLRPSSKPRPDADVTSKPVSNSNVVDSESVLNINPTEFNSASCSNAIESSVVSNFEVIESGGMLEEVVEDDFVAEDMGAIFSAADDVATFDDSTTADLNPEPRRRLQLGINRTLVLSATVVDDIPSAMFCDDGQTSETLVGNTMVAAFNHLHAIDFFYPDHEPLPGTYVCRFCQTHLSSVTIPSDHARKCAKEKMLGATNVTIARLAAGANVTESRCAWYSNGDKQCQRTEFKDVMAWSSHTEIHFRTREKTHGKLLCRLHPCKDVPLANKILLNDHMIAIHGCPLLSTSQTRPDPALRLVEWCGYCCRWISQVETPFEKHLKDHEAIVGEIVQLEGYHGTQIAARMIVPTINPFRAHDKSLDVWSRLHTLVNVEKATAEVATYVNNLDDVGGPHHCPATVDAGLIKAICYDGRGMSKEELRRHLKECHGFNFAGSAEKKKSKKVIIDNLHDDEPVQAVDDDEPKKRKRQSAILEPKSVNKKVLSLLVATAKGKSDDKENK